MLFEDWIFENYRVRGSSQWQLSDAECHLCGATGSDVRCTSTRRRVMIGTYGGFCHHAAGVSTIFSLPRLTLGKSIREVKKFFSEGDGYVRKNKTEGKQKGGVSENHAYLCERECPGLHAAARHPGRRSEFGLKFIPDDLRGSMASLSRSAGVDFYSNP
jgi:hypothetical protein